MRLIDADRAIKHYKALANIRHNEMCAPVSWADAFNEFILYLEQAPTVDAVEVVCCRDCKWYMPGELFTDIMFCHRLKKKNGKPAKYNFSADDFCSYGERKEE